MKRRMFARMALAGLLVALPLSLVVKAAYDAPADEGEAKAIAEKLLEAGAKMFENKDAAGLAATYTDDATITAMSRDNDNRAIKTEVYTGRAEIEKAYRELFKNDTTLHARNTIEYVRRPGSDVLIIGGFFEPDTQAADSLKLPFVQVRVKKGEAWKIANLQLFLLLDK